MTNERLLYSFALSNLSDASNDFKMVKIWLKGTEFKGTCSRIEKELSELRKQLADKITQL